jgi:hypothetical protein
MLNRLLLLPILLTVAGIYYAIGAATHFFGLTLFPFYDSRLYSPYYDMVIALAAIIIAALLFVVAKDPVKNADTLNVFAFGSFLAVGLSIFFPEI